MEYIRSLRTGIMAEYPVMSTSQGTYVRIEQTSEAIRVTYEICRAGGARGLELRTAVLMGLMADSFFSVFACEIFLKLRLLFFSLLTRQFGY